MKKRGINYGYNIESNIWSLVNILFSRRWSLTSLPRGSLSRSSGVSSQQRFFSKHHIQAKCPFRCHHFSSVFLVSSLSSFAIFFTPNYNMKDSCWFYDEVVNQLEDNLPPSLKALQSCGCSNYPVEHLPLTPSIISSTTLLLSNQAALWQILRTTTPSITSLLHSTTNIRIQCGRSSEGPSTPNITELNSSDSETFHSNTLPPPIASTPAWIHLLASCSLPTSLTWPSMEATASIICQLITSPPPPPTSPFHPLASSSGPPPCLSPSPSIYLGLYFSQPPPLSVFELNFNHLKQRELSIGSRPLCICNNRYYIICFMYFSFTPFYMLPFSILI